MNIHKIGQKNLGAAMLALAGLSAACHKAAPLTETATRRVGQPELPAQISDAMRFGVEVLPNGQSATAGEGAAGPAAPQGAPPIAPENAGAGAQPQTVADAQTPPPAAETGAAAGLGVTGTTPAGWTAAAATQFRVLNYTFGKDADGQAYVSIFPGGGGGILENANRWRKQMGQAPLAEADLADLPTVALLGQQAVYLEMSGDYAGMMGAGAQKHALMLGALALVDGNGVFVKLLSSADEAEAQREKFKAFCASLKKSEASAPAADAASSPQISPNATPAVSAPPFVQPVGGNGANQLTWSTPTGWQVQNGQQMRAASFSVPGSAGPGDCGVFLMPGAAGGVTANINRWRSNQMALTPLNETEIAKLPTTEIAGKTGKLVELTGSFTGMSGTPQPGYTLLGVICALGDNTLFVKLTGPQATVAAARPAFVKFCRELKLKQP